MCSTLRLKSLPSNFNTLSISSPCNELYGLNAITSFSTPKKCLTLKKKGKTWNNYLYLHNYVVHFENTTATSTTDTSNTCVRSQITNNNILTKRTLQQRPQEEISADFVSSTAILCLQNKFREWGIKSLFVCNILTKMLKYVVYTCKFLYLGHWRWNVGSVTLF